MSSILLDLTRMDVGYEIAAMKKVRASLEDHLRIAAEVAAPGIVEEYENEWAGSEAANSMAADEIEDLRNVVFPRLMRGSYAILLYAVFENCIGLYVEEARRLTKTDRRFRRPRQSLLSDCRAFFKDHLGYPLWDEETLQTLGLLAKVRHLFAHQAGRLDQAGQKKYRALEGLPHAPGTVEREYLVLSADFIDVSSAAVSRALTVLAEQLQPGVKAVTIDDDDGAA